MTKLPTTIAQWRLLRDLRSAPDGAMNLEDAHPRTLAVAEAIRRRGLAEWVGTDYWGEWDGRMFLTEAGFAVAHPSLRDPDPECGCCLGGGLCRELDYAEDGPKLISGERPCECRWDLESA